MKKKIFSESLETKQLRVRQPVALALCSRKLVTWRALCDTTHCTWHWPRRWK